MRGAKTSILFVCMGNICRSPTAEAVFAALAAEQLPELDIVVDSAGTHGYHIGAAPDPRSIAAAKRRGIDLSGLRARQVAANDFSQFDWVLAMDRRTQGSLTEMNSGESGRGIRLFLEFAPHLQRDDVPDPYYGADKGFEQVLDLVEEASMGLIEYLRATMSNR